VPMSLVQSTDGGNGSNTGTTPFSISSSAVGFGSSTTAGNLLVCVGYINATTPGANAGGASFQGLPATAGLTWVLAAAHSVSASSGYLNGASNRSGSVAIWYAANAPSIAPSATTVVTAHDSGSGFTETITVEFTLYEFSGVATATPVDVVKNVPGTFGGSGTVNPGTLVTTGTDLVLVAFIGNQSNISAGASYTLGVNATSATTGQAQYQLNVASGSIATAFTGSQTNFGATAVGFLPPSGIGVRINQEAELIAAEFLSSTSTKVRLNQIALMILAPAVSPCVVSYLQMVTDLSLRLADPNLIFWTKAELQLYLLEALRTWNALTEIWITALPFTSAPTPIWTDISQLAGSPRLRTLNDTDLYTVMQYHLLEPPSAGTWTGTSQFTIPDLQGALQRRRDEVIQLTACNLAQISPAYSGVIRTSLPNTLLEVVRARFVPNTGTPVTLTREDTQAFDHFNPGHLQSTALPTSFSLIAEPPLVLDLDTAPAGGAVFDIIGIQSGSIFNPPNSTLLGVPNDWSWVAKWGALADLLSRESEATDRLRADYCFKRYMDGIKIMQASNWLVSATIGGLPVDTPSMREMDAFANEWENDSTVWPVVVTAGMDLVAPAPVGTPANVVLNVIGNAPLPSLDGDCVSVLRDHYDAILDYAQVLASFKLGGAEFGATGDLEKKFFIAAQDQNKRLRSLGLYSDVLHQEGRRETIWQPRIYDTRG
jgi:hypothetical protein